MVSPMATSTSISVPVGTRDLLNELASAEGISTSVLVTRMAQLERENRLLSAMQADFARLQADEEGWATHRAETAAWDGAAAEP